MYKCVHAHAAGFIPGHTSGFKKGGREIFSPPPLPNQKYSIVLTIWCTFTPGSAGSDQRTLCIITVVDWPNSGQSKSMATHLTLCSDAMVDR